MPTKRLLQAVALLKGCPKEFEDKALKEVLAVIDEYESWLSMGRPPMKDWLFYKFGYDPKYSRYASTQALCRRVIKGK